MVDDVPGELHQGRGLALEYLGGDERGVKYQLPPPVEQEVGAHPLCVKCNRVVGHVVSVHELKQDEIRPIAHNHRLEHQVLLHGAESGNAEVDHLDALARLVSALCELFLKHRPECVLGIDLHRLGKGVPEHREPVYAFGLLNRMFTVAQPRGADPHVRAPFALEPAFDAGAQDPAYVRVGPVPNRGAESDDAKHDLEQQRRGNHGACDKAGRDQYSLHQSSSNLAMRWVLATSATSSM